MICTAYSAMHFLIDFLCAWAMFSRFRFSEDVYFQFYVYNFCAFALQMLFGSLVDLFMARHSEAVKKWLPLCCSGLGLLLTAFGAFMAPWILGCGNALFHVGGGIDVIREDFLRNSRGKQLGVFVAPGAVGLYLGGRLGQSCETMLIFLFACAVLAILTALLVFLKLKSNALFSNRTESIRGKQLLTVVACCFAVVILRSAAGFYVTFSWKTNSFLAFLWVMGVVLGKMSGGFLSAKFGMNRTAFISLSLAGICFLLGNTPEFGLAGIFLFNMTMPVTLYLLVCQMPELPGFAFGLLTFALFLGFLPAYSRLTIPMSSSVIGALGSVLSLTLLLACGRIIRR